jgi:hypothetical protein
LFVVLEITGTGVGLFTLSMERPGSGFHKDPNFAEFVIPLLKELINLYLANFFQGSGESGLQVPAGVIGILVGTTRGLGNHAVNHSEFEQFRSIKFECGGGLGSMFPVFP